jgi:hypothetical protein
LGSAVVAGARVSGKNLKRISSIGHQVGWTAREGTFT